MGCSASKSTDALPVDVRTVQFADDDNGPTESQSRRKPGPGKTKSAKPATKNRGWKLARKRFKDLGPAIEHHRRITCLDQQVDVLASLLEPQQATTIERARATHARLLRLQTEAQRMHLIARSRHFWSRGESGWRESTRFDWKVGWLEKKPSTGRTLSSAWRRRFIVLQADRISWYKSDDGVVQGELILTEQTTIQYYVVQASSKAPASEVLTVVAGGKSDRQLTLRGDDLDGWGTAIGAAVGVICDLFHMGRTRHGLATGESMKFGCALAGHVHDDVLSVEYLSQRLVRLDAAIDGLCGEGSRSRSRSRSRPGILRRVTTGNMTKAARAARLQETAFSRAIELQDKMDRVKGRWDLRSYYTGGLGAEGPQAAQRYSGLVSAVSEVTQTVRRLEAMFEQRRSFSMRCSCEGCLGYLNTQWKCGMCDWVTCSKCLTPAGKSKAECGRHRCVATGTTGGGLVASGI